VRHLRPELETAGTQHCRCLAPAHHTVREATGDQNRRPERVPPHTSASEGDRTGRGVRSSRCVLSACSAAPPRTRRSRSMTLALTAGRRSARSRIGSQPWRGAISCAHSESTRPAWPIIRWIDRDVVRSISSSLPVSGRARTRFSRTSSDTGRLAAMPPSSGSDQSARQGLSITGELTIPLSEVTVRASRSSGPGGQHANVTASRVEASFDVLASQSLTEAQRRRVLARAGPRLVAIAQDARSQTRNRELALTRLSKRLASALAVPKRRRRTRPSAASRERRLAAKRRASERKRERRPPADF
jgi:ribosome-associated protein